MDDYIIIFKPVQENSFADWLDWRDARQKEDEAFFAAELGGRQNG